MKKGLIERGVSLIMSFLITIMFISSAPLQLNKVYAASGMAQNILNNTSLGLSNNKKVTLSAMAEALLNAGYEPAFVAGMLGNFALEGHFGMFESSNYVKNPEPSYLKYMDQHWNYRSEYSGQSIVGKNLSKVYSMLCTLDSQGHLRNCTAGFGLGCAQWTFTRTKGLVEKYIEVAGGNGNITAEQAIRAEGLYMVQEINGSYHKVYNNWKNSCGNPNTVSAANSAGRIVCTQYEKPANFSSKRLSSQD